MAEERLGWEEGEVVVVVVDLGEGRVDEWEDEEAEDEPVRDVARARDN